MRRTTYVLLVAAIAFGAACSDGDENSGNNITDFNSGNNTSTGSNNATTGTNNATTGTNNATTGTNNATTGTNNNTTPTERCELDVANAGPMNGTWELVTFPSETKWFELRICHDLDDTNMDSMNFAGDFIEEETGLSGDIQTPSYNEEPFNFGVNWFVNDDGEEYQFGFSQGSQNDENTISGRFLNGRLMETTDAQLRRVE